MLVFLVKGIYELRPCDGFGCIDICTVFHIEWFSNSIFSGDTHADTQNADKKVMF
jgi:hypothetical protein